MLLVCRSLTFPIHSLRTFSIRNLAKRAYRLTKSGLIDLSLYLVTERTCIKDEEMLLNKAKQAIKGGITCLQLRDHNEDLQASIKTARHLKSLMASRGVSLIINNRIDVALAVGADGVHLGQKDFPIKEARKLLGKKSVIGLTVDKLEDVHAAEDLDVDYLGVQVFRSKNTKPNSSAVWGLDGLKKIKTISRHRIVAIGGIDLENLELVNSIIDLSKNQDGIAMVGALWRSEDLYITARKIRTCLEKNIPLFQSKE